VAQEECGRTAMSWNLPGPARPPKGALRPDVMHDEDAITGVVDREVGRCEDVAKGTSAVMINLCTSRSPIGRVRKLRSAHLSMLGSHTEHDSCIFHAYDSSAGTTSLLRQ
jgi:hypothetical protein